MNSSRRDDSSAGDVDYGTFGVGYTQYRQPDPRIASFIRSMLGDAHTVLNVGAGAGPYEPEDRQVTAVEPSASMRAQRPARLVNAIDAVAEKLLFPSGAFDASMTIFSVHQWSDVRAGLTEMTRVTRGPVLVLTCDPAALDSFWLTEYAPEVIATEARRYPTIEMIANTLGPRTQMLSVPIPLDCSDGFNEAYYGRPELLLDPSARGSCSAWSFVETSIVARFESALRRDLESGAWDAKYGQLRTQPQLDGSLRLIVRS